MGFLSRPRFSFVESVAAGAGAVHFLDGQIWLAFGIILVGVVLSNALAAAR